MAMKGRTPARFSLLNAMIWLLVAAGIITLLWQVITRISASNLPISTATPNLTQVYQTIAAMLTAQGTSPDTSPTQTNTPLLTAKITPSPSIAIASQIKTSTPGGATHTAIATVPCNQAAAGNPLDVTIPDNSLMPPGQSFTKTWKLVNTGTCSWTTSYSASFFYGDRMDAPGSVPLKQAVQPSQSIEISIEMIAPLAPGTYQGNWKMSAASGVLFGIGPNGDSPYWVRIIVSESPSSTPTVTQAVTSTSGPTVSPFPSVTATPPVETRGELATVPGDSIDLDTLRLNQGDEDLTYQVDEHEYHWLAPKDDARIGVFGNLEPSLPECKSANMSSAPIAVESLSLGTYLCYTTNEGRSGWLLLEAVDQDNFTLTLKLLTWALP